MKYVCEYCDEEFDTEKNCREHEARCGSAPERPVEDRVAALKRRVDEMDAELRELRRKVLLLELAGPCPSKAPSNPFPSVPQYPSVPEFPDKYYWTVGSKPYDSRTVSNATAGACRRLK